MYFHMYSINANETFLMTIKGKQCCQTFLCHFQDNIQNNNIRKCEFKTLPLLEYLKNSIINYPSMIRISDSNSIFTIIKFMNAQVNYFIT